MLCPTGVLRLLRLQNLIAVCFPPAPNLPFSSLPWGLDRSRSTVWLAGRWTDTRMGQRQSLGHCPLSHCSVEPWIPSRVCEDPVTGIRASRAALTGAAADAGSGAAPSGAAGFASRLAGGGQEVFLLAAQRFRGADVAAQLLPAADVGPEAVALVPGTAGQALLGERGGRRLGEGKDGVRGAPSPPGRTFLMSMSSTARLPPMGQFWM